VRLPVPGLRPRLHSAGGGTRRVRPAPGREGPARNGQSKTPGPERSTARRRAPRQPAHPTARLSSPSNVADVGRDERIWATNRTARWDGRSPTKAATRSMPAPTSPHCWNRTKPAAGSSQPVLSGRTSRDRRRIHCCDRRIGMRRRG
jgi:hypothetical protein